MMSRGTFNGPGGTHNRWQIPNQGGSALGPHHMLEYKNRLGVLTPSEQVTVVRDTLQTQGIAVVSIKARESVPAGDMAGLTVDFGATRDLSGTCANQGYEPPFFYCPNRTGQPTTSTASRSSTRSGTTRTLQATACCCRRAATAGCRRCG